MQLLTAILVAVTGLTYAQTAKITGTVLAFDQKAIHEAVVSLLNAKATFRN
jgi:hypothetical protein